MLTFDEPLHEYRYNGVVIPSVTQLIDRYVDSFAGIDRDILKAAQERGTFVHRMCELDDLDDLHPDEETGEYSGYLQAWRAFRCDYAPNWSAMEERHYSKRFAFAGTLDNRGMLEAKYGSDLWIIDKKTSASAYKSWGMQTAAYRQMVAENIGPKWLLARRGTVRLFSDGRYKFDEWNSPKDWPAFQALLTFHNWMTT